jgi:hypothetical protein
MAAKDGTSRFDFWGTYQQIDPGKFLAILLGDGRKMQVYFESTKLGTKVTEMFEPEQENEIELQQAGWQMILNNFKLFAETC